MKRALASVLVAGLCVAGASSVSFAGANANAKILLHVLTPTTKAQCTRLATTPNCSSVSFNNLALYPQLYFAHVLVTDGNVAAGIAGLQFGIDYGSGMSDGVGIDIFSWAKCTDLEFASGGFPANGGGNLLTWDATTKCQRTVPAGNSVTDGVVANAGYFYMAAYSPALFRIIPRPVDQQAKVADCAANEDLIGGTGYPVSVPSHLGIAAFGSSGGYNPACAPTPVATTTWSGIKSQY